MGDALDGSTQYYCRQTVIMSGDYIAYHEQLSTFSYPSQSVYPAKLEQLKWLHIWLMIVLHLKSDEAWYHP